jgi:signal transduction histidine kinase
MMKRLFTVFRTIQVRLTLLFVLLFAVTLFIFSSLLYNTVTEVQQREFDLALLNHAVDIGNSLDFDFFGALSLDPRSVYDQQKVFPFSLGRSVLQIRRLDGTTVMRSPELQERDLPFGQSDFNEVQDHGYNWRDITARELGLVGDFKSFRQINHIVKRPGYPLVILQIAVPKTFLEAERKSVLAFFLVSVPMIIFISAAGGFWFSKRALRPVSQIIEKTQAIDAGRLSERIPVPQAEDEIQKLSLTINDLLTRLQDAFASQERFVADASHQLKTPLAVLRGELDMLIGKPRTSEEVQAFLESASQEVNFLSKTIEDLLLLARVDAGRESLFLSDARLDELALNEIARLERQSRSKKLKVNFDMQGFDKEEPLVKVDRDLTGHMIYNLIENAIKYSANEQSIHVFIKSLNNHLEFSVKDQGPGVQANEKQLIFRRFYRLERSKTSGVGLGLAIAQKIAQLHGTTIKIESEPGLGSTFSFSIKKI